MGAGDSARELGSGWGVPFLAAAGDGPKLAHHRTPPPDVGKLQRQLRQAGGHELCVSHLADAYILRPCHVMHELLRAQTLEVKVLVLQALLQLCHGDLQSGKFRTTIVQNLKDVVSD